MSIGIGPTKTLAKIANRLAKKLPDTGGVFNPSEHDRDATLQKVEGGDEWGIGRQWAKWLRGQGINTALDLKHADPKGDPRPDEPGERIAVELNGIPCLPLERIAPPHKGITVSRSLGKHLMDREAVKQALLQFAGRAGEKLRREGLRAQRVTVLLMTSRFSETQLFYSNAMTRKLMFLTDYTPAEGRMLRKEDFMVIQM